MIEYVDLDDEPIKIEEPTEEEIEVEEKQEKALQAEILKDEENATDQELSKGYATFSKFFAAALKIPYIRVNRAKYIKDQLERRAINQGTIDEAIETTPLQAGIKPEMLDKIARDTINFETTKAAAISTVAGIPGAAAMAGTIPADLSQYVAHVLRVAQKMAYLYGWDDFMDAEGNFSEETEFVMVIFLGAMGGVEKAVDTITEIAAKSSQEVAKRITARALTKTFYYPIVKKVAGLLGIQMTKEVFGEAVGKAVPFVGAAVSGGITLATFRPMCAKLRDELKLVAK